MLNLRDLLHHEIQDLYSAEEQIIEALPKVIAKAGDRELKKALTDHLKVTREQQQRLDKVKKLLGTETPEQKSFLERIFGSGTKCKGTEGLIKEMEKMMAEDMDPKVLDAAIIAGTQKIEHYEISGYGTARAYARELGLTAVAKLLEETLNEEYAADDALTSLALNKVNVEAENGLNKKPAKNVAAENVRGTSSNTANKTNSSGTTHRKKPAHTAAANHTSRKKPAKKAASKKSSRQR
jgi:ferritin-like metal-binding protein YciE